MKKKALSLLQESMLAYIRIRQRKEGRIPSPAEVAAHFQLSVPTVDAHMAAFFYYGHLQAASTSASSTHPTV